jgi:hypothetical protein
MCDCLGLCRHAERDMALKRASLPSRASSKRACQEEVRVIIQKRLFGIPLVTQAQRRRAVVAYYLLIVLAILPALIRSKIMGIDMAIQSLMIGSIFGGFIFGGPVKPYIGTSADGSIPSGIQNLNLGAAKPWGAIVPLDERESAERDAAHYSAYVILRWSLFPITIIYFLLLGVVPQWVVHNSPTLFWLLVVVIISLPQSVILWNEASSADTEPTPIR